MTWARFDDQFPINRKVAALSDAAFRAHVEAIIWCAREGTDGCIDVDDLVLVSIRVNVADQVDELLRRRLWHHADKLCEACAEQLAREGTQPPTGGFVIHDWLTYNPSRTQVTKDKAQKADRQRRWRQRHNGASPSADAANPTGDASTEPSRGASRRASRDASADASVTPAPPRPAPPRKKGRAGRPPEQLAGPSANADDHGRAGGWEEEQPPPTRPVSTNGAAHAAAARAAIRGAAGRPQPAPATQGGRNVPRPDDDVWVAIRRRGVPAHRPGPTPDDGPGSTGCGRSMRTGTTMTALEAQTRHEATWCDLAGCWRQPAGVK